MIANPNYQLLVDNKTTTDLKYGLTALKSLGEGETCVINEENPSDSTASNLAIIKRFSIYQKVKNDKGKLVLIKHGGALPIVKDNLHNVTFKDPQNGVPQYWMLKMDADFSGCCENYGIRFGMYNDAIQKTMFPSELVETYSVENECCGKGCGNGDAYDGANILFRLWADVATHNTEAQGYVKAWLVKDSDHKVVADHKGNVSLSYTDGSSHSHTVTASIANISNGMIKYTDTDNTASTSTTSETTISEFLADTNFGLSGAYDLIFAIAAENETTYGQMNFKYDVIRNTVARVTLNGAFECAEGVTKISNNDATNAAKIYCLYSGNADGMAAAGNTATAVSTFAYSIGSGYDVQAMEFSDSLHTLNSPYTLSDVTLSENGISYRAEKNSSYYMLTLEYQQPSDGVTRVEHHPWGTTIAIKEHTSNYSAWEYFLSAFAPTGSIWDIH